MQKLKLEPTDRHANEDHSIDLRLPATDLQAYPRAKRKSRNAQRQAGVALLDIPHHRPQVILLAAAFVVQAGALADSAEVETHHRRPGRSGRAGEPEDDLVVQRAAVQRMGVANDRRPPDADTVVGAFVQSLQTAGGPVDEGGFEDAGHQFPR